MSLSHPNLITTYKLAVMCVKPDAPPNSQGLALDEPLNAEPAALPTPESCAEQASSNSSSIGVSTSASGAAARSALGTLPGGGPGALAADSVTKPAATTAELALLGHVEVLPG